ncbi:MAG: hypothetical protein ACJ0PU_02420, partial [Flavobacteriaceae bacterium]
LFKGCILMSAILPDKKAGPTFLNLKASKDTSWIDFDFFVLFFCPNVINKDRKKMQVIIDRFGFISICFN